MSESDTRAVTSRTHGRLAAPLSLCVLFIVLVWPIIFLQRGGTSEESDQRRYHEPVIRTFADEWPNVDLVNYKSATAPGYHLAMALFCRYISDSTIQLQLLNSLFGLGFVLVVYMYASRFITPWQSAILCLPIIFSSYLLGSAIWLTTDNAGLVFASLALGGVTFITFTESRVFRWGLYSTIGVFVRQLYVWTVASTIISMLLRTSIGRRFTSHGDSHTAISKRLTLLGILSAAGPLILILMFYLMWGGFTPPTYRARLDAGFNPATFGFALALMGCYGIFYLPAFLQTKRREASGDIVMIATALVIAVLLTVVWPTSFSREDGRWGGALWIAVEMFPTWKDRSLLLPLLAILGAVIFVVMIRRGLELGRGLSTLILSLTVPAFAIIQSKNTQCGQRYFELVLLLILTWQTASIIYGSHACGVKRLVRQWWIGPMIFGAVQLTISIYALYAPVFSIDLAEP